MEFFFTTLYAVWQQIVAFFVFDPQRLSEPEMLVRLTLQACLLLGSSFFSSSETALFSLSRLDLQNLRRQRHSSSEIIHAMLDQPRRLIISILCGNELINIAASVNMASILILLYHDGEQAFLINLVVMVPLLLLFGEVTPKTIAVSNPVWFSSGIARPMNTWLKIITPMRVLIRGVADKVTTLLVSETKARENILNVDEFRSLVEDVAAEGVLDATERALIYNLLEAGDVEVVEIMTPRTRTNFLSADIDITNLIECFRTYRHSRMPVFHDQHDDVVGFLHAEDVLRVVLDEVDLNTLQLSDLLRPTVVVPLTKRVDEMFDFFQKNNVRAALVLNEFGGVEGIVTMQDVLNFIFGPITDVLTQVSENVVQENNVYTVPGDMKLNDFNRLTNFGIEDPRMTTIGGVVFRHLDRLPHENDTWTVEDMEFKVLAMEGHRIAEVQVVKGRILKSVANEATQQVEDKKEKSDDVT